MFKPIIHTHEQLAVAEYLTDYALAELIALGLGHNGDEHYTSMK